MRIRRTAALLALALAGPLTGCGADTGDDGRTVVAAFYPVEYLTQRLAGEHLRVVGLTAPGVEPHDLELKVGQVAEISSADLVVHEAGLQPAVDEAVVQNASDRALDVGRVVDLEGADPHFWLDPVRMKAAARAIELELEVVDPDHADAYAANLAALEDDLDALDQDYRAGLSGCERDTVVTSHDAFGYLTKYGLRLSPIAGLSPDAEPSAAHLGELRSLIRTEGVTTVFSETLASPKMADTLSRDLGLTTRVLDPIEGFQKDSDEDYVTLMRANLAALQDANGCKVAP